MPRPDALRAAGTVLPGAEPFAVPGGSGRDGRTGVLLVHGCTGTPISSGSVEWIRSRVTAPQAPAAELR